FETCLQNVMRVPPAQEIDVQVAFEFFRERAPEMFGQLDREIADSLSSSRNFIDQIEAARKIDYRTTQGLVHGNDRFTVPRDPGFVAERFGESLTQANRDVFD